MNISMTGYGLPMFQNMSLKSTQEKVQRQQKADRQIGFLENQKNNLKSMECGTPEEIARKLEMFHTYENEIAAVKAAYNQEQMFHVLDEAKELGEKIAEKTEKLEAKTPEERRKETAEEAMGTEESGGMLDEIFDEIEAIEEETLEELEEEELAEKEQQESRPR